MEMPDLNPFLRFADLQPAVLTRHTWGVAYDYRIFYILNGTGTFFYKEGTVPLAPGSLLCFPPQTPYYFRGALQVIVLNFDLTREWRHRQAPLPPDDLDQFHAEHLCRTACPAALCAPILLQQRQDLADHLWQLCRLFRAGDTLAEARASATLKALLCDLAAPPTRQDSREMLAERIQSYIRLHACEGIQNRTLSDALGYHPYYLNRVLRERRGVTLHRAILEERMRVAQQLLTDASLEIEEIATACGFTDRSQFSTAFRRYTGLPPARFRREGGHRPG